MAQVDYFIKFDSIEGESVDSTHKGSIELLSFSWGLHNNLVASAGAARAGRPSFEDFHFTAHSSKASPKLFLASAKGSLQHSATLSARKSAGTEGKPQDFLVIKMENVLISSYNEAATQNGQDDFPADSVSLNFAKITFTFVPQNPNGESAAPVTESWDLKAQKL